MRHVICVEHKACFRAGLFYVVNFTRRSIMKTLCPNCFSNDTYPVIGPSLQFPQSLESTLLSPAVLAGIGASLCRERNIPPSFGMLLGTMASLMLSVSQQHLAPSNSKPSLYCRNCNRVFDWPSPVSVHV